MLGYSYTHPSTIFAKALYPYQSQQKEDLSVDEDTVILILDRNSIPEWYIGSVDTSIGLIPRNYVQVLSEAPLIINNTPSKLVIPSVFDNHSDVDPRPIASQSSQNSRDNLSAPTPRKLGPKLLPKPDMPKILLGSMNQLNSDISDNTAHQFASQDITQLTWPSLIDSKTLSSLSTDERKRQESIFELIKTEATYVRDLQLVVELFYAPLQNLLASTELTIIFGNIEQLLLVNSQLLSSLEAAQCAQKFMIDKIGDVFSQHLESLNCYLEYCGSQMKSSKLLQKKRKEKPRIGEFLKECQKNPRCRSLDLSSFLLEPMQRITRYPLLFKQVRWNNLT